MIAVDPSATELGTWGIVAGFVVGVIGACVAIAVGIKKLLEPRSPEQENVTRAEVTTLQMQVTSGLASCVTKTEFAERFTELKETIKTFATKAEFAPIQDGLKDLQDYTREQMHRQADAVNTMGYKMAALEESQKSVTAGLSEVARKIEISNDRLLELKTQPAEKKS